jgi:UDP-N-acetylmuramyl pentapeptide phosphotransferase/UDP-N-acetylglucosamine-1-phosphate transferase
VNEASLGPLALAALAASLIACLLAAPLLRRWGVVDVPNHRSSHSAPVLRGGGIGFVVVILAGWAALAAAGVPGLPWPMLAGAAALAAVSFADDVRGIGWNARLAVQAVAVAAGLLALPVDGPVLWSGLPLAVDRILLGLMWLWFVNLFNFMDGINGIAATEAAVIAFGIAAVALVTGAAGWPVAPALVVGGAVLGFLPFNLPAARMFMGDVGSTTLGFTLGWLLILVAAEGTLATAILLALYFVADATSTLLFRAARRERLHEAHRHHAYQRAVDRGLSHGFVAAATGLLGVVLVVLGGLALDRPALALALGLVVTGGFILWLRGYLLGSAG